MSAKKVEIESKLKKSTHVRFSDAPWYGKFYEIVLGGVGGIGSYVALLLARMGHSLIIYDNDEVDETNEGGQLYKSSDKRSYKVDAIAQTVREFVSGAEISTNVQRITAEEGMVTPIMISAFDNMTARRIMFDKWKDYEKRELFIDGRMSAECFEVYFVTKGREEEYVKTLFEDSEIEDEPCSFKATSHTGAGIAFVISIGLSNYITNKEFGEEIRELPLCIKWYGSLLMLKNE